MGRRGTSDEVHMPVFLFAPSQFYLRRLATRLRRYVLPAMVRQ